LASNVAVAQGWRTLTFAGGEYHTDVPTIDVQLTMAAFARCRPKSAGALAWASGEVVFDSWNPTNGGARSSQAGRPDYSGTGTTRRPALHR